MTEGLPWQMTAGLMIDDPTGTRWTAVDAVSREQARGVTEEAPLSLAADRLSLAS